MPESSVVSPSQPGPAISTDFTTARSRNFNFPSPFFVGRREKAPRILSQSAPSSSIRRPAAPSITVFFVCIRHTHQQEYTPCRRSTADFGSSVIRPPGTPPRPVAGEALKCTHSVTPDRSKRDNYLSDQSIIVVFYNQGRPSPNNNVATPPLLYPLLIPLRSVPSPF